jgi:hypothetical protein
MLRLQLSEFWKHTHKQKNFFLGKYLIGKPHCLGTVAIPYTYASNKLFSVNQFLTIWLLISTR